MLDGISKQGIEECVNQGDAGSEHTHDPVEDAHVQSQQLSFHKSRFIIHFCFELTLILIQEGVAAINVDAMLCCQTLI